MILSFLKVLKLIIIGIKFEYNSTIKRFVLWAFKRKANRMHKLTGKRYHVLTMGKTFTVVDNSFIKFYNKEVKNKSRKIDIHDLIKMSYYSTAVQSITRKYSYN